MKFKKVYEYSPRVDIYAIVSEAIDTKRRLSSLSPDDKTLIRVATNINGIAKIILAAGPNIIPILQDELLEISHYKNPQSRIRMIKQLLEKQADALWASIHQFAHNILVPEIKKELNISLDEAEDAFTEAVTSLFNKDDIEQSIQRAINAAEPGAKKPNKNAKKTIFDRLFEFQPNNSKADLMDWLYNAVLMRAKTEINLERRRKKDTLSYDDTPQNSDQESGSTNIKDEKSLNDFNAVEDRASYEIANKRLLDAGLHRIVKARDLAQKFNDKVKSISGQKQTLSPKEIEKIGVVQKQIAALIMLSKDMMEAYKVGDQEELESLNTQFDNIMGRLEHAGDQEIAQDESRQTEEMKRRRYLTPWLNENAQRKANGLPLLKWSNRYMPPTESELTSFGLTLDDLQISAKQQTEIEHRQKQIEKRQKRQQQGLDYFDQQSAYDAMDRERQELMPYMYQSWAYPALTAKERAQLKHKELIKPIADLHRGIGHPDYASKLFGENVDYSSENKDRLWAHLMLSAAMASNDKTLFDRKNKIKGEDKENKKVALLRFVEHVQQSPIYKIDPDFFQKKLDDFLSKAGGWVTLTERLDVYTRAAAYEQARYTVAGNTPWNQLTTKQKDEMALSVWEKYYKHGYRTFRTVKITDNKEEPTSPLDSNTDVSNYLYRIRAEIERISLNQKKWVSTSAPEQAKHKGHQQVQPGKTERKRSIDEIGEGDHTNNFDWFETNLWNENGLTQPQNTNVEEKTGDDLEQKVRQIDVDFPSQLENAPNLHAYKIKELVRLAQVYDESGLHDEADLVDEVINAKAAEAFPVLNVRFVASNDEARSKGLMYSEPLHESEAALFVFEQPGRYAFWNKNVNYPLTLAFLDQSGKAVDFADLDANSTAHVEPKEQALYVIEAQRGAFRKLGVNLGDKFELSNKAIRILRTSLKKQEGRK